MAFDLLQAAGALIAADTVSDRGNLSAVPLLCSLASEVGMRAEVIPAAGSPRNANILFRRDDDASDAAELLLLTHTDTVAPGSIDAWSVTPPFQALIQDDRLYGLGSADAKVDLLAKLLAADRFRRRPLSKDFAVLATYGEEIGLLGAKEFVRSKRLHPRFVVCGEPSELRVIHAHKGYVVARVEIGRSAGGKPVVPMETRRFQGRAAHSSTPSLGDNAIEKALSAVLGTTLGPGLSAVTIHGGGGANSVPAVCQVGLGEGAALPLREARAVSERWHALVASLAPERDVRFDPPTAVSNFGWIEGAAGQLTLLLDARLLPGHSPESLATAFESEVGAIGGRVTFERQNPAVYTDPSGELCQAARAVSSALRLPPDPTTKATNTEAAAFADSAEAIVFGPGVSRGNAHCANEHTSISQLLLAIDWYAGLIGRICN
jgi:acetylornithine deacetylase/succinyl-diaminopimelate desuccinylase-like protein